ncbi:MAG: M1 family aminopeptidase [Cyclobacteriaceae bacterium]
MKSLLSIALSALLLYSCAPEQESLLDVGIPLKMAEYRKQQVSEVVYELSFNIPESKDDSILSLLNLKLNIKDLSQPLYLDFNEKADHVLRVAANGESIKVVHEKEHLIIPSEHLKKGENSIEVAFLAGELSLNRNEDFLYTLLVPDRASTLFPCFDQPDIKANYQLTITAPKDWAVICGAPLKESNKKGESMEHQFGMTDKMSTYLFSFVAGRFETANQNPGEFDMQLLYRETNPEKIEASIGAIFDLHQQSINFLKNYTGYDFPFQKLDFACIPGFQYGGMEHVGAIQYRESSLFLDNSATEVRKLGRGKLIAHETSHMWFGDLVTMKWFNDVWMKEVFANFMADKIANPAFPDINHELQFVTGHYPSAYSEDRTRGTNPIRQKLDNLKNAGTLYGRIIYNKAPIMMRQLEAAMGKKAFQEGIQEYIKTYANGNADWNNLVEILDGKTLIDMKQWSEVWVNQSGRPVLSEDINYDEANQIFSLDIVQNAEDGSNNLWPQSFNISLVYADTTLTIPVKIEGSKTRIDQATGLPKPIAIIYNSNGFGYGLFPINENTLNSISGIEDEISRGYSYLNSYENTLSGSVSPLQAFELYRTGLRSEKNELIIRLIANQLDNIYRKYLTDSERNENQQTLEMDLYAQLQTDLPPNIKKTLFNLYRSVAYSESGKEQLYQIWKKELVIQNLRLNEDDYTGLAMDLAVYEHTKAQEILEGAKAAISNPDKLQRFEFLLPALSSDVSVRDAFFESLRDPVNREKESWVLSAASYIHHPLRQKEAVKHLQLCLELLEEIQQTGDIFFPKRWLTSTIGRYSSKEAYDVLESFLNSNPDFHPVLKNKLLQATDDLYRVQGD